MRRNVLTDASADDLIAEYARIGVEQDDALLRDQTARFNRLFKAMDAIEKELRGRTGDQRRALLALFDHPNLQVQLNAAKATLALEPSVARAKIEEIQKEKWAPQGLDAGMTIFALDEGIFKPS